jgi:hypothetical protein
MGWCGAALKTNADLAPWDRSLCWFCLAIPGMLGRRLLRFFATFSVRFFRLSQA